MVSIGFMSPYDLNIFTGCKMCVVEITEHHTVVDKNHTTVQRSLYQQNKDFMFKALNAQ